MLIVFPPKNKAYSALPARWIALRPARALLQPYVGRAVRMDQDGARVSKVPCHHMCHVAARGPLVTNFREQKNWRLQERIPGGNLDLFSKLPSGIFMSRFAKRARFSI